MPNTHVAVAKTASQNQKFYTNMTTTTTSSAPQAGETLTITCFTCAMPSSTEWAQKVSIRPSPTCLTKPYYPFLSRLTPPSGAILEEDGSTFLCAFCHASLEAQWHIFEKSQNPVMPKDRQYNSHNFTCAVCSVETYRKRVRALPFQEFPFLIKERQPGSITLGDNPLAVVCLDCSETLWAQSAEYDRWGLPIQKRHFNWMARPPPPEDSMEATVARLPSGETQLPRCSPLIRPRVVIDPRKPSNLMSNAQIPKMKPKSNKVDATKRDSKSDAGNLPPPSSRKYSAPIIQVSTTSDSIHHSQPPVVTVAPMSSHQNSSSFRKGNVSVPPNLVSSSSLPKGYPVSSCNVQSQAPPALTSIRPPGPPLYPTPTYAPYLWSRREIDEHFQYNPTLESARSNFVWNWLTPQQSPDLARYQSYLSQFENRNFNITDNIFNGLQGNTNPTTPIVGTQPMNAHTGQSHPPCFLPPPFLPTEFGSSHSTTNTNVSPIHNHTSTTPPYSTFEEEMTNHVSKMKNRPINNNNHRNGGLKTPPHIPIPPKNSSVSSTNPNNSPPQAHHHKSGIEHSNRSSGQGQGKDFTIRRSSESDVNKNQIPKMNEIVPRKTLESRKSHILNNNRRILPKKRKYHFEPEEPQTDGDIASTEPMDYSFSNSETSENERDRRDSNSISASDAEGGCSNSTSTLPPAPVDLTTLPNGHGKNEIPPNFMIAYLCSQNNQNSSNQNKDEVQVQPPKECKSPNANRDSVIVSMIQGSGGSINELPKSPDGGTVGVEVLESKEDLGKVSQLKTPVYDNEILIYKTKPGTSSEPIGKSMTSCRSGARVNDSVKSTISIHSCDNQKTCPSIITSEIETGSQSPMSDVNANLIKIHTNGKTEMEIETFVEETLEIFKQAERMRIIKEEKEIRRKVDFLKTLDLVSLQDKSDIELRKLISRFERSTLPPLKFRPESPPKKTPQDEEFEKQIVVTALEDPSSKQITSNIEQLSFMNNLNLKPASRAEKFRREQEWRLFLLERKLREKRDAKARGIMKPWDKAISLSKLLLESRKFQSRRNSNPGRIGISQQLSFNGFKEANIPKSNLLSGGIAPAPLIKSSSNIEIVKTTVNSLTSINGIKPIINYPKYIPSYSTVSPPTSVQEKENMIGTPNGQCQIISDEKQNPGDQTTHKSVLNFPTVTGVVSMNPTTQSLITPSPEIESKKLNNSIQSICIPKIPIFNSTSTTVNWKRLETVDSGDCEKLNGKENGALNMKNGFHPEIKMEEEPELESDLISEMVTEEVNMKIPEIQQNGMSRWPKVDPIIQGYRDYWLKTKNDIEEIITSATHMKPDKKCRRLAVCEMKRLRKTLISHQSEMKLLEKKLRKGEKEIQNQLVVGNTHVNTRLG